MLKETFVRRRALLLVALSLALWSGWNLTRTIGHPYADLGNGTYTDHFSHMNTARIFTKVGLDIWRKPLNSLARHVTEEERLALPEDLIRSAAAVPEGEVFAPEGWPTDKPFISSWSQNPRFHPVGNMVLTAPVAIAYSYTDMSFTLANRLLIQLFLIYGHISLYFVFTAGFIATRLKPVGFLVLFIVYGEVVHWALEGFYEAALIAPLILCARWVYERKPLLAILAFCIAANIHFRAFFMAPWAIAAVVMIVREKSWKEWKRREWILAGVSTLLALMSLGVFSMVWDYLRNIPAGNKVSLAADPINLGAVITLLLLCGVIGGVLYYANAWLDLAILAWVVLMALNLREALPWDTISLMPWLIAPIDAREDRWHLVRDARLAALGVIAIYVFNNPGFFVPGWLDRVFT